MAVVPVVFSRGTYNTATNEITLTYESSEPIPAPPAGVRADLWYPGPKPSVTFKATLPQPVESPQTAVGGIEQPDGSIRWYKATLNGATWTNITRVADPEGNPFQAFKA
jgi:hypothetical protein